MCATTADVLGKVRPRFRGRLSMTLSSRPGIPQRCDRRDRRSEGERKRATHSDEVSRSTVRLAARLPFFTLGLASRTTAVPNGVPTSLTRHRRGLCVRGCHEGGAFDNLGQQDVASFGPVFLKAASRRRKPSRERDAGFYALYFRSLRDDMSRRVVPCRYNEYLFSS